MSSERPILFSGEMVRAILEGRKTQTRRVINQDRLLKQQVEAGIITRDTDWSKLYQFCPYGRTGDRLWVRESFWCDDADGLAVFYAATDQRSDIPLKPAIFMPRAYSRITLEIVNVRVEQVQNISQADAKAEGAFPWFACGDGMKEVENGVEFSIEHCPEEKRNYRKGYEFLWDAINAKRGYGWDVNPFVWVVEFKVVQQ